MALTHVTIFSGDAPGEVTLAEISAANELTEYLTKRGITVANNGFPITITIDTALGDDSYRIAAAEAAAGERIDFVKRARYRWRYIKLCLHPNAEEAQALIADVSNASGKVSWREKQWNVDASSDLSKAPTEWKYKS